VHHTASPGDKRRQEERLCGPGSAASGMQTVIGNRVRVPPHRAAEHWFQHRRDRVIESGDKKDNTI